MRAELASAREELSRTRRTLEDAQRLAHLGSWEWDLQIGAVYWSAELFRLHGFEPDEVVPDRNTAVLRTHPDDLEKRRRWLERLASEPRRGVRGDAAAGAAATASIRPITARGMLLVDEMGEPLRYVGTVQDMSVEARSRETERLLSQIVMSTSDAVFTVDPDMRVQSWNPAAERLYGYTAEEIVGQHVDAAAPGDRRPGGAGGPDDPAEPRAEPTVSSVRGVRNAATAQGRHD